MNAAFTSFLRLHPRLIVAMLLGIVTFLIVLPNHRPLTAGLVGWDTACWVWIVSMAMMMAGSTPARRRETAGEEDVGAAVVLSFVCVAASISVAAVIFELASTPGGVRAYAGWHYLLAMVTVAGSWLAVGLVYTTHYAHVYYASDRDARPLRFPESHETPGYWDFLYFAFTISVAAQTSDVTVCGWQMRRLVVIHSIIGFVFNAAIIGFSINMFAGALAH